MGSDQRELLLEESQDTHCLKKSSFPCTLIWILVSMVVIALAVGLVILFMEQTVKPPFVDVDCGRVEGVYDARHNVRIFKGIPYAAPPVGKQRWRRPVPLTPKTEGSTCWSETLQATTSNMCPQLDSLTNEFEGDEDCLKLDVWAPSSHHNEPLPVAVYIHGGGLRNFNSSVPGYGPDANLTHDLQVIFVSINYRLGPFGFLVAEELGDDQTGNYGIWDQIEALKWVKRNIASFGGDPEQITIMGQSSGATSVKILLVSPYAKGLFQRAWMMSASPRLTATLKEGKQSLENRNLITKTRCKDAECLRNLPARIFFGNESTMLSGLPFFPTEGVIPSPYALIDGDLIPDRVEEIWKTKKGNYSDVPILIGTTAQEMDGTWPNNKNKYTHTDMLKEVNEGLKSFGPNISKEALAIYNFSQPSLDPVYKVTTLSSDIFVTCGNNELAAAAAGSLSSPVYRYIVTSFPSSSASSYHGPWDSKFAFHCWDSFIFFDGEWVFLKKPPQKSDFDFKQVVKKFALEFIKDGRISGWKKYPEATAFIDRNVTFKDRIYHEKQCAFWKDNGILKYEWSD